MKMICENAGKCSCKSCDHQEQHDYDYECKEGCKRMNGVCGSECIPYIEPAKEALTDHPKYCRLSKQAGGLCEKFNKHRCIIPLNKHTNQIETLSADWTICPRPEKQQPVELPKDPLKELVKEYYTIIHDMAKEGCGFREVFWEFTQKVRAL